MQLNLQFSTLPYNIFYTINKDIEDFEIKKNLICNKILSYYIEKDIELEDMKSKNGEVLQFNLNKDNDDIFYEKKEEGKIENVSNYFRNVFNIYVNQPKYKREQLLFSETVEKLNEIIKDRNKAKIKYRDEYREVEPYAIANSGNESRNYLFCYCYKNASYRNYRLKNIERVRLVNEKQEHYNEISVKDILENFDPYLSYGKKVKVRLTKKGEYLLKINYIDRPKLLLQEKDIFTFECSEDKAKLYFAKFFKEVEIIEPVSLREWVVKNLRENLEVYE